MSINCEKIHLLIADIHFVISSEEGINLQLTTRYSAFQSFEKRTEEDPKETVKIRFCHQLPDPDTSPCKIWEVSESSPAWKVFDYLHESRIFVYESFIPNPTIISLSHSKTEPTILIKPADSSYVEVFKYPMDIILLYWISIKFPLLIVHASGFQLDEQGQVCLGNSGAGKSTLYNLALEAGGNGIQDDRLILRPSEPDWFMYALPLRTHEPSAGVQINRLNALVHGTKNLAIPLTGSIRSNQFLPHMVHFPNWNHQYQIQINLVAQLLRTIRMFQFFFIPDLSAIDYLQNGKNSGPPHYIPPEKPMPSKIKGFWKEYDSFYLPR